MNNKTLLLILPIFSLLSCGAPDKGVPDQLECEPYSHPVPYCKNDQSQNESRNAPHIMINSESLNVTPACVRARREAKVIVVNLTPVANNEVGSAKIFPKGGNEWPVGTNDPDKDVITIDIPEDLPLGYYDYGFVVNGKCIDPRVHVER